jgi:L-threonylcarbamoyladenylate synthase
MPSRRVKIDCDHPDPEAVLQIAEAIKAGEVLVYPTDTIYGLGCDAFNSQAVARINRLKARAAGRPVLNLIPGRHWLFRLATEVSGDCLRLVDALWPGPLTLVLRASCEAPAGVLGGGSSIGIRWARHPFLQTLLEAVGGPIVSSSANISGERPLQDPGQEQCAVLSSVDWIVDGGVLSGRESSVVDLTGTEPQLIREGAVALSDLRAILGCFSKP